MSVLQMYCNYWAVGAGNRTGGLFVSTKCTRHVILNCVSCSSQVDVSRSVSIDV